MADDDKPEAGVPGLNEVLKFLEPKPALYCPETPTVTQRLFMRTNAKEVLFGGMAGGGKGIYRIHDVVTPFGLKKAGDVRVGDQLVNPEGGVSRVIAVYDRGVQPAYRVTFSDGASVITDGDHLWRYRLSGKTIKRDIDWRVCTTPQLAEHLSKAKQEEAAGKRPHWPLIPLTEPVEFTVASRNPSARWPVDPYALGVLLGDGCLTARGITFASADVEIVDAMRAWAESIGLEVRHRGGVNYSIASPVNRGPRKSPLRRALETLDVCHRAEDKRVPDAYLVAPLSVRSALIQGLMDADGYVDSRGHASFVSVSKQLALDVQFIARSLGYKATITDKVGSYRNDQGERVWCQTAYTVTFSGRNAVDLFRLTRKRDRCLEPQQTGVRRVVSVDRMPDLETVCFTVDHPNGLFLATDEFIVTHNSSALLMAALQYVDVPGYAAILFRRTFADLVMPNALMDRFKQWIGPHDEVHWNDSTYTATFPSGARITFGYLNNPNDKYRYQGIEVQFAGFDELTHLREEDYRYLASRLRKPQYGPLAAVPLRMRGATNPAPNWVRQRFIIEGKKYGRIFIPSSMETNPGVDVESYRQMLAELDPVERRRLEFGDWFATTGGSMFKREDFVLIEQDDIPSTVTSATRFVRYWDLAASDPSPEYHDPDWTVGTLMMMDEGRAYVLDVVRIRARSEEVERTIAKTAARDGRHVPIRMEQEPGSAGKSLIDQYARYVLPGYDFKGERVSGDKITRARPFAAHVANGYVSLAPGDWHTDWLDELSSFPEGATHDDKVDSAVGAFNYLSGLGLPQRKRVSLIL